MKQSESVFWIQAESLEDLHNNRFNIIVGNPLTEPSRGHHNSWTGEHTWDYYPRGSVVIDGDHSNAATIYLSSVCDVLGVIDKLVETYGLTDRMTYIATDVRFDRHHLNSQFAMD